MQALERSRGRFFTVSKNPFKSNAFQMWASDVDLPKKRVLEPFAGANNIIQWLKDLDLCNEFVSYDIAPASEHVERKDTIQSFPTGFDVCITNPPWLARNSATRRGLPFPTQRYDDLYKLCLELCLNNCEYVAALIPASYLQSGLFRERLDTYVLLHDLLFEETENPVCLALFSGKGNDAIKVFYDDQFIGNLDDLESMTPEAKNENRLRFNDPEGTLGFISFDNSRERSIRFCDVSEIEKYEIKVSSRFITRISGEFGDVSKLINTLNQMISKYRDDTHDIFLTPFKGIRQDGQYRRRMFFSLARRFINAAEI